MFCETSFSGLWSKGPDIYNGGCLDDGSPSGPLGVVGGGRDIISDFPFCIYRYIYQFPLMGAAQCYNKI